MTILIVTNRVLNEKPSSPEFLFGETLNAKGGCEIRLATFDKNPDGTWRGDLIEEADEPTVDNVPSREKFRELRGRLINDEKDCVFYVHGYNKSFAESLEQCWEIQERYGVEVVGFSWPADPAGVSPFDYFQARRVAASSAPALDLVLEKMGRYFRECLSEEPSGSAQCGVSFNLVIHSLGAFLFETFVRSGDFSGETRFFDNIVLNPHFPDELVNRCPEMEIML
jgi:esterase/lipase superfamily enzyme